MVSKSCKAIISRQEAGSVWDISLLDSYYITVRLTTYEILKPLTTIRKSSLDHTVELVKHITVTSERISMREEKSTAHC